MSAITSPYVKYAIAILVVVAIAEFAPEAVNVILALILVGMLLMDTKAVQSLASTIGSIGK